MSVRVVGTCSLCGGAVTVPLFYWSVVPPMPQCSQCRAVPAAAFGPVIPMKPTRVRRTLETSGGTVEWWEVVDA